MNESIFKAYDIRGVYPDEINENVAYTIGISYGSYLQEFCDKKKCVIGYDNRLSSPSLKENLIKGLLDSGINVIDYGMITTPMHYYTRMYENTYGIMVTASHNPKDDNGFKFSFDPLANARGEMIENFKEYTLKGNFLKGKGMLEKRDIKSLYLKYIKDNIKLDDKPLKIVIDPGNGVTTTIIKDIMKLFPSIDVTYICDENDGTFPNHHPDPAVEENMQMLKEKVLETNACCGIAYDGDGDRLGMIDELGNFIMADKIMIIAVKYLLKEYQNKTILCDVKCSKALIDVVNNLGGKIYMNRTGTSFTESATKEHDIPLGGELSGHLFFNDRGPEVCSAIYAGLRILEILSKTDKTMSQILEDIPKYYSTPEIKIPCSKTKFKVVDEVKQEIINMNLDYTDIDGIRFNIDDSWGLIRVSNTGPNITLRFESKDNENLLKIQKKFTDLLLKHIP